MNRKRKTSYPLLAAILALSSTAVAADTLVVDDGSQDVRFNAWIAPFLQELNLTEKQQPKFLAIQKAMTAKWAEFQKMPPHERKTKQEAFYKARFEELEQLLTPGQMTKYREIRARRWTPQSGIQAASAGPSCDSSEPFIQANYSGNDIEGIETIVNEIGLARQTWREQADERIDQLRKANLEIRVVDADGNPLSGVPVHVQQCRHLFRFGGIVGGPSMHEPAPGRRPRPIPPEQYKKIFLELGFNTAGFNSYLKYKRRPMSEPYLPALFAWFQEHDIPVRGHCLIWPGGSFGNFMPPELSEMVYVPDPTINWRSLTKGVPRDDLTPPEKQSVRDLCEKMIEEASRQWPVFEWDVINETRDNHVVQDLVGRDVMVDWFKTARQSTVDREALLYLNENKVISDPAPGDITENMKRFEKEVRYLLDNGAPLSAIGFQSRFGKKTPPETIYKRLQYFEKFNLPIAATEFEMKDTIGDEFERAAMTERAMTVLFSHRLVNGIYAWSLLAQDQGGPGHRAILEDDGRLKLRGKVWMYLMKNRWWTDEVLTTGTDGMVTLRGFKGDYLVTVGDDGAAESTQLHLDEDRKTEVTHPSTIPAAKTAARNVDQAPASSVARDSSTSSVSTVSGSWTTESLNH